MNLYRIDFGHWAPKDSEHGFKGYVLAENDDRIYHYVDKEYCYDSMEDFEGYEVERRKEYNEGEAEEYQVHKYSDIDDEPYKTRMIRLRGQVNDDEGDHWNDLYYGVTLHGWTLIKEDVQVDDYTDLIELKVITIA